MSRPCSQCANAERQAVVDDSRPWARDTYFCGWWHRAVDDDDTCEFFIKRRSPEQANEG